MIKEIFLAGIPIVMVQGNCGPCSPPPRFYEELNCVAIMEQQGDCCAVRYDCPDLTIEDSHKDPTKCYYSGKEYNLSQQIFNESWSCFGKCTCSENLDIENGPAVFYCDISKCQLKYSILEAGQSYSYSPDKCCHTGKIYADDRPSLHQCSYRGINTVKGEKFTPPENPCYWCVCDENFQDDVSPSSEANAKNCHKLQNWKKEIKQNCAPVYKGENSCCPIDWICPKDNECVEIIPTTITVRESLVCKFGDQKVKRYEGIKTANKCRTCTCKIPPFLTCIETPDCN